MIFKNMNIWKSCFINFTLCILLILYLGKFWLPSFLMEKVSHEELTEIWGALILGAIVCGGIIIFALFKWNQKKYWRNVIIGILIFFISWICHLPDRIDFLYTKTKLESYCDSCISNKATNRTYYNSSSSSSGSKTYSIGCKEGIVLVIDKKPFYAFIYNPSEGDLPLTDKRVYIKNLPGNSINGLRDYFKNKGLVKLSNEWVVTDW